MGGWVRVGELVWMGSTFTLKKEGIGDATVRLMHAHVRHHHKDTRRPCLTPSPPAPPAA